jgi:hypothetical protein
VAKIWGNPEKESTSKLVINHWLEKRMADIKANPKTKKGLGFF